MAVFRIKNKQKDNLLEFDLLRSGKKILLRLILPVFLFSLIPVSPSGGFGLSAVNAQTAPDPTPSPIHSFWSTQKGYHFYTASSAEKDAVIKNYPAAYKYEGTPWNAFSAQEDGMIPVYRFLNTASGYHFYTASSAEKDAIIKNYPTIFRYEGIAWYAYSSGQSNTTPVYRLYNPTKIQHFFTSSPGEKNCLVNNGWKLEGNGWWVPLEGANVSTDETSCGTAQTYDVPSDPPEEPVDAPEEPVDTPEEPIDTPEEPADVPTAPDPAPSPIYSFWNTQKGYHFYTASSAEKDAVIKNYPAAYKYEGTPWNAFSAQEDGMIPVYRFLNTASGYHFYTASSAEKDAIIKNYPTIFRYEGIAWYAYSSGQSNTTPVYRLYNPTKIQHFFTSSPGEKNCLVNNGWKLEGNGWWVPLEGANVSTDETSCDVSLGPEISVGVWNYTRDGSRADPFEIEANESYVIKDRNGSLIATLAGNVITKVKYDADGNLKVYSSIPERIVDKEVIFEPAKAGSSAIIFNAHRPDSTYDEYRGKMKVRYGDTSTNIWVINILPLEHYIWGIGEITGTGDEDYNRTMTTAFRTYGYWKILYSTKYAIDGFKVDATSASQIYRGYEWEVAYPRIKAAAIYTQGKIAKYGSDIALTPFSSWTDGRTRSFEERWGGTNYPWCQSVADPYGKHATMTTAQLVAAGNHMVGISAHGALNLATNYNWAWDRILKYYLTGITITKIY